MAAETSVYLLMVICSSWFCLAIGGQTTNHHQAGKWQLLKPSIGISAMHMALLPNDKIIVFDRSNFGPSNISLPQGKCPKDYSQSFDCYAHSVEFDPSDGGVRPLTILTDTWCSSGALSPDGVLVQSGGFLNGERVVRHLEPRAGCDWVEDPNGLNSSRWYASNQVLPNGKIIVVGGRFQFSYEFIPKTSPSDLELYHLPFLQETRYSAKVPNNLYPFLHLSPDGNLFIFANDRAILLDYLNNKVIRKYPVMPGGFSRNYPSTGSSVLLPLHLSAPAGGGVGTTASFPEAVVFVCGGTLPDSNMKAENGTFVSASKSCGRLAITAQDPKWEMEEMPIRRVMGDMILLPTGDVLIINGAAKGTAGWNVAAEPVLNPVLYRPAMTASNATDRFQILSPTHIPRLYHSTAHLLLDGRVLVGGSNPNRNYNFSTTYPTELSLEAFEPPYMSSAKPRPLITRIERAGAGVVKLSYKQNFNVGFKYWNEKPEKIYLTMVAPSFTTHSFAMNQRLLVLEMGHIQRDINVFGSNNNVVDYVVESIAPATPALAPPGYYLLFVVCDDVPSTGMWVRIN